MTQLRMCRCGRAVRLGEERCPNCGKYDPTDTIERGKASKEYWENFLGNMFNDKAKMTAYIAKSQNEPGTLNVVPQKPNLPLSSDMAERKTVQDAIEKVLGGCKSTKRDVRDIGDKTTHYRDSLVDGDLELIADTVSADNYASYGVKAIYRGELVFAERARNNVYIKGEWEAHLARLVKELK